MVIVATSTDDGQFYVETKSLDGETNLKTRNIQDDLGRLKIGKGKGKEITAFKPSVEVEAPNANMHKFNGAITFDLVSEETDQKKSLSLKNIALRGMSLRNTEWIVGLVVYSGADTKIQKNLQDSTYKISNLLHKTNKAIIWIFVA